MTRHSLCSSGLAALMLLAGVAACTTTDKIVYRDVEAPPKYFPAPAGSAGYLGFNQGPKDSTTTTTVCGTCHVATQAQWATTKHATAWADLQASGHAAETCNACHTVSNLGTGLADANVAFASTKDPRFRNVQCENCHGPGQNHVDGPGSANNPLAIANQVSDPTSTGSCGACHQGEHNPFLEEWAQSPHGAMPFTTASPDEAAHIVEGTNDCQGCHSGEIALRRDASYTGLSFKANVKYGYKEANHVPTGTDFMRLGCVVCHDPHSSGNEAQLRFKISTTDTTQNLCARCHQRNSAFRTSTWRGPHSPETQLFYGLNAGWRPAAMPQLPTQIAGTHADASANPKQCVTCHMPTGTGTTGHLFRAIPCLDANGLPTAGGDCAISTRNFKACTGSGCHASETGARSAFSTAEVRLELLMEDLKVLLENTTYVPCAQFATTAGATAARGARFNYLLASGHAEQPVDVCTDASGNPLRSLPAPVPSEGAVAHNPLYIEQLLIQSIKAVKAAYYTVGITGAGQ